MVAIKKKNTDAELMKHKQSIYNRSRQLAPTEKELKQEFYCSDAKRRIQQTTSNTKKELVAQCKTKQDHDQKEATSPKGTAEKEEDVQAPSTTCLVVAFRRHRSGKENAVQTKSQNQKEIPRLIQYNESKGKRTSRRTSRMTQ